MTADWQALASQAIEEGYTPGSWEMMLRQSIERKNPELVKELGEDFPAYLVVKTHQAKDLYVRLTEEGTDPYTARELAMGELLANGTPLAERQEAHQAID